MSTLHGFDIEYADGTRFALVRNDDPIYWPPLKFVGSKNTLDRTFRVRESRPRL